MHARLCKASGSKGLRPASAAVAAGAGVAALSIANPAPPGSPCPRLADLPSPSLRAQSAVSSCFEFIKQVSWRQYSSHGNGVKATIKVLLGLMRLPKLCGGPMWNEQPTRHHPPHVAASLQRGPSVRPRRIRLRLRPLRQDSGGWPQPAYLLRDRSALRELLTMAHRAAFQKMMTGRPGRTQGSTGCPCRTP